LVSVHSKWPAVQLLVNTYLKVTKTDERLVSTSLFIPTNSQVFMYLNSKITYICHDERGDAPRISGEVWVYVS
jgi:hypothetical protein